METAQAVLVAGGLVSASVLAAVILWVIFRRPSVAAGIGADETLLAELSTLRDAKAELESRLAVEVQKASRIPDLEAAQRDTIAALDQMRTEKFNAETEVAAKREALAQVEKAAAELRERLAEREKDLEEASDRSDKLRTEKAELESQRAALNEALGQMRKTEHELREQLAQGEAKLSAAQERYEQLSGQKVDLEKRYATLQETLEQERAQTEEKLALLTDARERLTNEFKVLSEEILQRQGATFAKQNKEQVETILEPLRGRIVEFQQVLQTSQTESAKERAALAEQIRNLGAESAKMMQETTNLTRALKGKAQTQGVWGEMILSTLLERSGLREGQEYQTQKTSRTEEGGRLRPDVIVNLPGGQCVVVDSKVSLTAFEAYVNGETEEQRAASLRSHINSIRSHIKLLSSKDYERETKGSLDYVVMFVPIEGALAVALQEEPDLTMMAADQGIAVATPTTLLAMLKTVANVWNIERRHQNADDIANRAGALYDKFVGFVQDMQTIGSRIDNSKRAWTDAMNKLSTGHGNLVRQADMLKILGAKAKKALPDELLEAVQVEPENMPLLTSGDD